MVFYEEEIHGSIIIYADGNSISEMMDQQGSIEEFEIVEGGYKGEKPAPVLRSSCSTVELHPHYSMSLK